MSNPAHAQLLPTANSRSQPSAPPERQALAKRILVDALFLGSLADALLHDGAGIGLFIWMIALGGIFVYLVRNRSKRLTREQTAWLGTALFFSAAFAWRDSSDLLFYDFCAMLGALAFLGATLSEGSPVRSVLGQHFRSLLFVMRRAIANGATGIARVVQESGAGDIPRSWRSSTRLVRGVRASLLALPLLLVFGLLFGAADPLFVSIFSLPHVDIRSGVTHVFVALVVTWIVAGWLYGAVADEQKRSLPEARLRLSLGTLEISIILGGLVALFALFVGVQIEWLFGGERLVRSTTGLGYAQYARHGFFELVCVAVLILPVLLGTRDALSDDDTTAIRRHRLLTVPLLLLVGGVMASALGRMTLYVHYYGLSTDRFFASVFMGWLAVVFTWFGLTTLRGRPRDFAAGMAITGFMTLGLLNLVNHEALVTRVNVARASTALRVADSIRAENKGGSSGGPEAPIDYRYLTRLDADGAAEVVRALTAPVVAPADSPARAAEVKARCQAVERLFDRWIGKSRDTDWRRWNVSRWRARRAIEGQEASLRKVTCLDADGERAFGDRDSRRARPGEQWYQPPSAGASVGRIGF